MGSESTIEWTDASWNPVRGCDKISPGCKNCYAETFSERWRGIKGHPFEQGFDLRLIPEKLDLPLRWKRGRRIFVNSMSDLFHEDVPNEYIAACFGIMGAAPQHTFQVLTKRAWRMNGFFAWLSKFTREGEPIAPMWVCVHRAQRLCDHSALRRTDDLGMWTWPRPNIWLGVSAEDQKWADQRIHFLLDTPAAVRFVSYEPALGPIDFKRIAWPDRWPVDVLRGGAWDLGGFPGFTQHSDMATLDWVIAGAESGRRARPMEEAWVRAVRDQCEGTRVKFFYKQRLGEKGRKVSLPVLDGRQWAEFPEART